MAYIKMIDYDESSGELRGIYDHLISSRGKLADVHRIQSLNPPTVLSHMNLYRDIMFGQSPLKRAEREMIAVVVSISNQCEYCMNHHREALAHLWKSEERVDALIANKAEADLSEKEMAICQYARELTLTPELHSDKKVKLLRKVGLDDRAILDVTLVVGYFNFVNRIALALGLEIKSDEITGYKY